MEMQGQCALFQESRITHFMCVKDFLFWAKRVNNLRFTSAKKRNGHTNHWKVIYTQLNNTSTPELSLCFRTPSSALARMAVTIYQRFQNTIVLLINGAAEMGSKSQRTNAHGDFQVYQFTKDYTVHFIWITGYLNIWHGSALPSMRKAGCNKKANTSDKDLMSDS
jgi:uncharacterized protein YfaT (DUF1175 family)